MLSGSIPTTIFNLSFLQILDVSGNFLRMELPSNIGNTLPILVGLGLHDNMFHNRKRLICREQKNLPGAFYRAPGKGILCRVLGLEAPGK